MIKVNRKDLVKQLSNVKEDNIGIADIIVDRKKLLSTLKLQDDDVLSINYGTVSWQEETKYHTDNVDNELCVQFSCGKQTFRFLNRPKVKWGEPEVKHLNFIDYLQNQEPKVLTGTPIDTDDLLEALTFVLHGVATEQTRPVLNCVLFDSTETGILKLVSADGFRLPVSYIQVDGLPQDRVMIHSSDIKTLINFLKSNTTGKGKHKIWLPVYLEYKETELVFSSELVQCEFVKQTGNFPDYERLIPQHGTHIQVIATELLEAVKAVTPMAKDGSGIVRLKFCKGYPFGKVTVSSKSEEIGDTTVDRDAKVESDCQIAFNSNYLKDFLSTAKGNIVDLFVKGSSYPMVAHNGIDQFEVIMPIFVQWE